ncbi:MAG: CDP-alcohol phosphatidyltransferase family protein [Myxococcota bacterium]
MRRTAASAFLASTVATGASALAVASVVDCTPWFVAKAMAVPLVLGVLALPSLQLHGHATLGPANAITLARAVLVGLCAAFVGEPHADAMVWPLFFASGAAFWLDWVDGRIARASGRASPFGARLDMELDAITILALCGLVWQLGHAGAWVFVSGALRYLFVAAGFAWPWMNRPLFVTSRRAWVCGIQVVCLLGAILPWPVPGLTHAIALFGTASLLWSFAIDTHWLWIRRTEA